jgi:hypothetical protein
LVGAWVKQTEVDAGLGALRARLSRRGRVRIRLHLVRVMGEGDWWRIARS